MGKKTPSKKRPVPPTPKSPLTAGNSTVNPVEYARAEGRKAAIFAVKAYMAGGRDKSHAVYRAGRDFQAGEVSPPKSFTPPMLADWDRGYKSVLSDLRAGVLVAGFGEPVKAEPAAESTVKSTESTVKSVDSPGAADKESVYGVVCTSEVWREFSNNEEVVRAGDEARRIDVPSDHWEPVQFSIGSKSGMYPLLVFRRLISRVTAHSPESTKNTVDSQKAAAEPSPEPAPGEPRVGEGWRELGLDEVIEHGDECFDAFLGDGQWRPCVGLVGRRPLYHLSYRFRRRLLEPSAPAPVADDHGDGGTGGGVVKVRYTEHGPKGASGLEPDALHGRLVSAYEALFDMTLIYWGMPAGRRTPGMLESLHTAIRGLEAVGHEVNNLNK